MIPANSYAASQRIVVARVGQSHPNVPVPSPPIVFITITSKGYADSGSKASPRWAVLYDHERYIVLHPLALPHLRISPGADLGNCPTARPSSSFNSRLRSSPSLAATHTLRTLWRMHSIGVCMKGGSGRHDWCVPKTCSWRVYRAPSEIFADLYRSDG